MTKLRAPRRRRRLQARPLLVAAGTVLTLAAGGCGVEEPFCATHGICAQDLHTSIVDMGIAPPPDLKPSGD